MKLKLLYIVLILLIGLPLAAQTKDGARKMFLDGDYAGAKPIFLKYLKRTPKDAGLNYWYAACCRETNDSVDVEPYLTFAASKKIVNANRYLGDYYADLHRYADAAEYYDTYLSESKESDSIKNICRARLYRAKKLSRMVKVVQKVTFIDSTVVDKEQFLTAFKQAPEAGKIMANGDIRSKDGENVVSTLFENEMGDVRFFAEPDDSSMLSLFSSQKIADEWSAAHSLEGLTPDGNQNYPFMLSDGITLYFAADGSESLGGYDIFVTRYNSESDRYLLPENIGMPFNSTANDYLYVVDEMNNLGWFATDRNQPDGKVCVYVFIPNSQRETFDFETIGLKELMSYAQISSIAMTQTDGEAVRQAKQRLIMSNYRQNEEVEKRGDFRFVIDDLTVYTVLNDFKCPQAKQMYKQWMAKREQYEKDSLALEGLRDEYAAGSVAQKGTLAARITALEEKVERLQRELPDEEIAARNEEKNYLTR